MNYTFSNLSPADFEDLARDLIGHELGIRFEAFCAGPDGGIDGRHSSGDNSTILQAKHYAGSAYTTLKSKMRRERASIDRLPPSRYVLMTSRPLSPANKSELATIIGSALKNEGDILGADDVNSLLRKHPEVEKAHIKLWLSSTAILEKVVHSAAYTFSAISKDEIEAKVRVYAQNPSFKESKDKLEANHVLIISGPPGVGKTTLAEMLSYAYIAEGWEFVAIRSLDDGFAAIVDVKKQIFFFDDFLGTIALDARALASKDSDLARFMRRIRTTKNARFILTTRAYIFEEARSLSEHLADQRLDISKYVLDVGVYTRQIKARILYNHLMVADTPRAHTAALIESGAIAQIVDHKNYNPRVVEWMTDALHTAALRPDAYPRAFLEALANPQQLWDKAFRHHIPDKCRHFLFALFFCSEYGEEIDDLRTAYSALHPFLCGKFGLSHGQKDFDEALRILEGGFIAIKGRTVSFINPSIRDFLVEYLNDIEILQDFATVAKKADWAKAVWRQGTRRELEPELLRAFAGSFIEIARKFSRLPTSKRSTHYQNAYITCDLSNMDRILQLIAWWEASLDERFATLAVEMANNPVRGFDPWRDGEDIVELVTRLRDGGYFSDFPFADDLVLTLESSLVSMLRSGMASDDLEKISDAIEIGGDLISPEVVQAAVDAILAEIEEVEAVAAGIDSESTLKDHIKSLIKLAPRACISAEGLAKAISTLEERVAEIEEQTSVADAPSFSGLWPPEPDKFDDIALRNFFDSLLEY